MARNYFIETLPARRYYGKHATGWVLLVNGHPHHFPDKRSMTEALEKFETTCKKGGSRVRVAENERRQVRR